jgi:phytoene dehydrogenase-like protein
MTADAGSHFMKLNTNNADERTMIIIGAGVAGLAAGIYARMNGYRTTIFEMHDKPGGSCTAWRRKGYLFDHCVHNLAGSGASSELRGVWEELGALRGSEIVDEEAFVRIEGDGKALVMYADIDRLERHLKELAPNDSAIIEEYVAGVRKMGGYDLATMQLGGVRRKLALLPFIRTLSKYGQVTLGEFAQRFTDPFMRKTFSLIHYGIPAVPVIANMSTMAALGRGDMGRPSVGSMQFARNIESRYLELGGKVVYNARVESVLVEGVVARGVRLTDGTEHLADVVVSAADGHTTIYKMLGGRYTDELISSYYRQWVPESEPFATEVFIGADFDVSGEAHATALLLDEPMEFEGREIDRLDVELFDSSTGMAPAGKSVIKVVFDSSYAYWDALRADGAGYAEAKAMLVSRVVERLEARFPGLGERVEVTDVVTPVTNERYTGTHRGYQCWPPKEDCMKIMSKGLSRTLPGLENFYMAGQWAAASTGLATAAVDGRNVVREVSRRDGKRFATRP